MGSEVIGNGEIDRVSASGSVLPVHLAGDGFDCSFELRVTHPLFFRECGEDVSINRRQRATASMAIWTSGRDGGGGLNEMPFCDSEERKESSLSRPCIAAR